VGSENVSLTYATLCSGIEGFGLGFDQSGMRCVYQCERDKQAMEVLKRHYPDVPKGMDVNDDDTAAELVRLRPDLVAFGFPCQDLSVAGHRDGLAGQRSGLFFRCMELVTLCAPDWVVIENVPGLLSSNGGRDMGAVVGKLGQLGFWWAYRVLDAQYDGVAQRRERVFIVGHSRNRSYPFQVLFDCESLPGNPPPSRKAGAHTAATLTAGVAASSGGNRPGRHREDDVNLVAFGGSNTSGLIDVATACNAHGGTGRLDFESETFVCSPITTKPHADNEAQNDKLIVTHTLRGEGFDASEDGTGRGTLLIPVAYQCHGTNVGPMGTLRKGNGNETGGVPFIPIPFDTTQITHPESHSNPSPGDPCHPLAAAGHALAIAFTERGRDGGRSLEYQEELSYSLPSPNGGRRQENCIQTKMAVRRLLPVETERLQGFPDDWTRYDSQGKEISDSARYRMIGNAVCVNVAKWIGQRIVQLHTIQSQDVPGST
jgi:DNA (cytosine-5)-methyltransferase 1